MSPLHFNTLSLAGNDPIPTQGLDGPDPDMPALRHYESDSGDDDDDRYEGDNDEPSGPSHTIFIPSSHTSKPMMQMKLSSFRKAETKEERAERRQWDSKKFHLIAEGRQKAVEQEKQEKVCDKHLKQNTCQQKHCDCEWEERMVNRWVPGQRVSDQ